MRSFAKQSTPARHIEVVGEHHSGKSTMIFSNARKSGGPIIVLDYDGRTGSVAGLASADVIGPENPMDIAGAIAQIRTAFTKTGNTPRPQSIVVDSVTPLFQAHSRSGAMKMDEGGNRAAQMVGKSNVVALLASLTGFGCDVYYVYHMVVGGRDSKGQLVSEKYTISEMERGTLARAISARITCKFTDGRYTATFSGARAFNGVMPNQPFTIIDPPGNLWKGGLDRIEKIAYTTFNSRTDAERFITQELGLDEGGTVDFYEHCKAVGKPAKPSDMWLSVLLEVDKAKMNRLNQSTVTETPAVPTESPVTHAPAKDAQLPTTQPEPIVQPVSVVPDDPFDGIPADDFDTQFPMHEPTPVVVDPSRDHRYSNGQAVNEDAIPDFLIYEKKFKKVPPSAVDMIRAKEYALSKNTGWA